MFGDCLYETMELMEVDKRHQVDNSANTLLPEL